MAARKKGSRRIAVDGVEYVWRFPRRPSSGAWDGNSAFVVTVQLADRTGSVLCLYPEHRHPTLARLFGSTIAAVTPSQIAAAVQRALDAGWRPAEGREFGIDLKALGGRSNEASKSNLT